MKTVMHNAYVNYVISTPLDSALVIRAARRSYGIAEGDHRNPKQLLKLLMKNGHNVPFEHVNITFDFYVPVYIARQLYTYRTWSRSERSMRYVGSSEEFFPLPTGVYEEETREYWQSRIDKLTEEMQLLYHSMREDGIRKEHASRILPMNTMTFFMATLDLNALRHFLLQRLDGHTQWETRLVAKAMFDEYKVNSDGMWCAVFEELYPELFEEF